MGRGLTFCRGPKLACHTAVKGGNQGGELEVCPEYETTQPGQSSCFGVLGLWGQPYEPSKTIHRSSPPRRSIAIIAIVVFGRSMFCVLVQDRQDRCSGPAVFRKSLVGGADIILRGGPEAYTEDDSIGEWGQELSIHHRIYRWAVDHGDISRRFGLLEERAEDIRQQKLVGWNIASATANNGHQLR